MLFHRAILLLIVLFAASAHAESLSVNAAPGVAQSQLDAMQALIPSNSAIAAIAQANAPQPCGTVPASDTLNGSVGATNCYTKATDTRATAVQRANITADSSGNWSITFGRSFVSSSPIVNPLPINSAGSQPIICNVQTRSSTGATGKCWSTITTTLPSVATSLLGLIINPTGSAANASVMIVAGEPTQ